MRAGAAGNGGVGVSKSCDTCKHWTPPETDKWASAIDREFGHCNATPFREDAGGWDDDYENWTLKKEHENATAIVSDASGYHAALSTRGRHFCAMWVHP